MGEGPVEVVFVGGGARDRATCARLAAEVGLPARAADAKGGNATPAYVEFEISSEPSQRAAA